MNKSEIHDELPPRVYMGFTVENFAEVPEGFKTVDERKVVEAYRAGVRSIPGLRIIEGEVVIVR